MNLSPSSLKDSNHFIAAQCDHLINLSVEAVIFPAGKKIAKRAPVHKSGSFLSFKVAAATQLLNEKWMGVNQSKLVYTMFKDLSLAFDT